MTDPDVATTAYDDTHEIAIPESPLDRRFDMTRLGWAGVVAAIAIAVAIVLRFAKLDAYALSAREGAWAFYSWTLYTGHPLPSGEKLPLVSPLYLIFESGSFFLFGVTDAIARAFGAIAGVGIVLLVLALRPVLSREAISGAIILTAVSPTLVYASRTIDPAIVIAFCTLLALVVVVRAGDVQPGRTRGLSALLGAAVAGAFAAGPEGITSTIAISLALLVTAGSESREGAGGKTGPVSAGLRVLAGSTANVATIAASFVIVTVLAFSRLLTNFTALQGVVTTFSEWGRMMASQQSTTPTQFFLYAALLYEFAAVIFAIVAVSSTPPTRSQATLKPTLFGAWFIVSLVLHSLASGRQADQTVLVTFPLVLLGGIGLGRLVERIPWSTLLTTRDCLLPLGFIGLAIGAFGAITLIARSNDPHPGTYSPVPGIIAVIVLVVIPFGYLIYRESLFARIPRYFGWSALLVAGMLLGFYTIRTTTQLAWVRADTGVELVAQNIPTAGTRAFINQTLRLSRDLSLGEVSAADNTGSYGISIAVDPAIEWPFTWYFRNFRDLRVTSPAGWNNADMVIAPTSEGMEDAGYVVRSRAWMNRVPTGFDNLSFGTITSTIFSPSRWYDGFRFVLYRDLPTPPVPEQMSVGYTFRLSNQMNPTSGPFDLAIGQSLGPGAALGQLNRPTGIATSPDGSVIYIVDSGNRRIQRFAADGTFIGAWSSENDPRLALGQFDQAQQGASDITVGPDGLIYVADTWNHRIMVLDSNGRLVREIGHPGELTNIGDSPDPNVDPGLFYGPRGIALANGEIYVTDTGNERVQVFAPDGTFLRAFGGYGTSAGKLIEPVGITIGPDGNVYVADTGNARISVFSKDGTPLAEIAMPGWDGFVGQQSYVKTGPDGIIYISSPATGEIFAWSGSSLIVVAGSGTNVELAGPVGMTFTANGDMMVTESADSRVETIQIQLPDEFLVASDSTPVSASPQIAPATPDAVG